MYEGFDISNWQQDVDFDAIATGGKKYAIVRGGDGNYRDPRREYYAKGLAGIGLQIRSYHFLRWNIGRDDVAGPPEITAEPVREKQVIDEQPHARGSDWKSDVPLHVCDPRNLLR